jgi:hypothetical protein
VVVVVVALWLLRDIRTFRQAGRWWPAVPPRNPGMASASGRLGWSKALP